MSRLIVCTLNLWNDQRGRWLDRMPLIAAEVARLEPAVLAVQEVDQTADQLAELARSIGTAGGPAYRHVHQLNNPKPDSIKSLGILASATSTEEPSSTDLGHGDIAFRVRFDGCDVVTTHLLYRPGKDGSAIRGEQAQKLLAWLDDRPTVVMGDFNAAPSGQATAVMKERFRSAHEVANGGEPQSTHPTPMSPFAADAHHSAIDYIFVSTAIEVVSCSVAFASPAPDDPALYPSDHYGLVAELELP